MKDLLRRLFGSGTSGASADWRSVRSMMTPSEREHLFNAASQRFTGAGAVVDLGTWLGGSTAALAAGVLANSREQARSSKVHAYDQYEMNAYMKRTYSYPELANIPLGGSFRHVFEHNMAPWATNVEVHAGDLAANDWTGGPIELVHVDIMKNWALTNAVLRKFFKAMIPGVTMVMHQDFVHYNTVWIHLVMYRLRDHFEPIGHVRGSTTFEFLLRSAIPEALLFHTYSSADFDAEEEKAAFAWSRSLVDDPFMRFNIDAAEAMNPLHKGDRALAQALLSAALEAEAAYKAAHPEERRRSELAQVKARLEAVPA